MEYNQNSRNPQAANQSQQQGKQNSPAQQQPQAIKLRQNPHQEQQGLGKKSQGGNNPYNKAFNPKQQQQHGKNQNLPPR